ncbi:hypothetical protein MDS_1065 [Ectopseudomonas mendocina NK-01]|nr:hypothetical protein MDS_1065 [Pseudomonas mendocina NK-01]
MRAGQDRGGGHGDLLRWVSARDHTDFAGAAKVQPPGARSPSSNRRILSAKLAIDISALQTAWIALRAVPFLWGSHPPSLPLALRESLFIWPAGPGPARS